MRNSEARVIDPSRACIPSNYSRLIARELGLQARDVSDLLSMTQVSFDQFLREDTLLTSQQQLQILQNSLRLANDDTFGLRMGQRLTSPTHGAMGYLANSSPDLLTKSLLTVIVTAITYLGPSNSVRLPYC